MKLWKGWGTPIFIALQRVGHAPMPCAFEMLGKEDTQRLGSWYPTLSTMKLWKGWGTLIFIALQRVGHAPQCGTGRIVMRRLGA